MYIYGGIYFRSKDIFFIGIYVVEMIDLILWWRILVKDFSLFITSIIKFYLSNFLNLTLSE